MRIALAILVSSAGSAGLAQEICTKELLEQRDADVPSVIVIPNSNDFVKSIEDLYDCSFTSNYVFSTDTDQTIVLIDDGIAGRVEWYVESQDADGGAWAIMNLEIGDKNQRYAVGVNDLQKVGENLITIHGEIDFNTPNINSIIPLLSNEAYPGLTIQNVDFLSQSQLLPGVDFDEGAIITGTSDISEAKLDLAWFLSWMLPPRRTTVHVSSLPSQAQIVENGVVVSTTDRSLWAFRDSISDLKIHLEGFQICDSSRHIISYSEQPPNIRLTCVLER